ncbi:MAG: HAD-IA family hydrolase [Litoreibacter sp.]|nr:HAD-IA family hydrolase [Litoreibacter sp.]
MFAEVDLHGMNDRIDMGAPFKETIYQTAEEYPQWRSEIQLWHDQWIEMAKPEIPHSVHLLRTLREKGVQVFSLTNFGVGSFDYAVTKYPFLVDFDRQYISGHLQVIKPDPEIYRIVEEDCGLPPETLLFTDDRADNIEAANARSWKTHLFTGTAGWAQSLVGHGLLSEAEAQL